MATELEQWTQTLDALLADVQRWCESNGWAVARERKPITESKFGTYDAPVLMVRGPGGVVYVEPVAQHVAAADGLVDIYAWPTLRRMLLVRRGDRWELRTDSGVPWPHAWSESTFREIVPALGAAA